MEPVERAVVGMPGSNLTSRSSEDRNITAHSMAISIELTKTKESLQNTYVGSQLWQTLLASINPNISESSSSYDIMHEIYQ